MGEIFKMLAGVTAGLAMIVAVLLMTSTWDSGEGDSVENAVVALKPEPEPAPKPEPEPAPAPEPASVPEPPDLLPEFDVVRIDPDGNTVVAGRASPGAVVEILLDERVIASAPADAKGEFVSIFSVPVSDGPHRLDLRIADADAAETQVAAEESGSVVILPGTEEGSAPAIVQSEPEGLALLQPASLPESTSESVQVVVLDRISYDDGGDVDIQGRAVPGHVIRAYVDSKPMAEIPVSSAGEWHARLDAETGRRAGLLRLDEIDAGGKVVSRVETELTYGVDAQTEETGWRTIEISKGDYLWRIAERFYGKGVRYSVIFSANTNLIRNPDLIYPGQVFAVPDSVEQKSADVE